MSKFDTLTKNDATYAGVSLSSFGAFVVSWSIPPTPNTRDYETELDGHSGIYDAGTELSRLDIDVTLGFYVATGGAAALRANIRRFMTLVDPTVSGYRPLSFADDPTMYVNAKLTSTTSSSAINVNPENNGEAVYTVDLQFKAADPFWYSTAQPSVAIPAFTSSAAISNPGVRVPVKLTATLTASTANSFNIACSHIDPVTGLTTQVGVINITGLSLTQGQQVVIDTDTWAITANGSPIRSQWTGSMFRLPVGSSTLQLGTYSNGAYSVVGSYVPRWLG